MKLDRTEQQRAALSDASAAHNLGFYQQVRIRINDHRHDGTHILVFERPVNGVSSAAGRAILSPWIQDPVQCTACPNSLARYSYKIHALLVLASWHPPLSRFSTSMVLSGLIALIVCALPATASYVLVSHSHYFLVLRVY